VSAERARRRIEDNPFYVLELAADCSRIEAERQGQKLMAMLELGLAAAASYPTPLGSMERTVDKVRAALAELRDPKRRLLHELWYVGSDKVVEAPSAAERPASERSWLGALALHGWKR